jgi:VirE N-terminal domain
VTDTNPRKGLFVKILAQLTTDTQPTRTALDTIEIQQFDNLYDPTPTATLALGTALDQIIDGTYRHDIETCRHICTARGGDAYKAAKSDLPQWTFGGTFAPTRAKDHLTQHSGICHADIDHLANLAETKLALMHDPHVIYCFTSPRGDGLKYGVRVPVVGDDDAYKHAWSCLASLHAAAYAVEWDSSGKDICRLCFVSWDPACYVNLDAEVYPIPAPLMVTPPALPRRTMPISHERREQYAQRGIANAVKIIAESTEGNLHAARCRAGYLLGGYVGGGLLTYDEAYAALRAAVEGRTKHLGPSLKTIADCLTAGEAKPITLAELEADWEQWKAAHPLPPLTTPPTPDMTHPGESPAVGYHMLPGYLKDHPDPRVRRHWQRLYHTANAMKQRLLLDPYAIVLPSHPEGALHGRHD